jgi:hypothetical protein
VVGPGCLYFAANSDNRLWYSASSDAGVKSVPHRALRRIGRDVQRYFETLSDVILPRVRQRGGRVT